MSRVKRGFKRRRRVNKVRDMAEGYYLGRGAQFRRMTETVDRALKYQFRDRKNRKREFRSLWIARLSAAVRSHDVSYNRFMDALKKSNIVINRKMLSDIAIFDPSGFKALVEKVRSQISA